jgi:hypothetical protein
MIISKQESNAINVLRFICILFLLLHHSAIFHLVPDFLSDTVKNVHFTVTIPFLQILFILSGYLFFYQKGENLASLNVIDFVKKTYTIKLSKRVKSLLIPYVIWSLVSIVYQIFVKHRGFSLTNPFDFIMLFWDAGEGHPIGMALWFVRNLIVFAIVSPIYFIVVKYLGHLILFLILFLSSLNLPLDYSFFNVYLLLGCYFALSGITLESLSKKTNWLLCILCYLFLKILELFHHVELSSVVLPLLLMLGVMGALMKYEPSESLKKVSLASTFIYFCHPYFTGIRNIYMSLIDTTVIGFDIMIWFVQAATNFAICYCIYLFLKKFVPRLLSVLQGNR